MTTARTVSALLVLAVLLAGCNGYGGTESTSTVSPVPVVPDDGTESLPGVSDGRLVDPQAVLSTHADVSTAVSYSARRMRVERMANGTVRTRTLVTVTRAEDGRYRATVVSTNSFADRMEYWFDGEHAYLVAITDGERRHFRAYTGHGSPPLPEDLLYYGSAPYRSGVASQRALFKYVAMLDGREMRTTRSADDRVRFVLETDEIGNGERFAAMEGYESVENVSFTLRVGQRGLVRRYDLRYVGRTENRTVRVRETVRYSEVGSTTVTAPEWEPEAAAN